MFTGWGVLARWSWQMRGAGLGWAELASQVVRVQFEGKAW